MANFYRVALSGLLAIAACWLMLQPLKAHAYPATATTPPGACTNPAGCTVYTWSASWAGSVGPTSNPAASSACPAFNGRSYTAPASNPFGMQAGETRTVTASTASGNDCAITYTSSRGSCCGGGLSAGRATGTQAFTPPTYTCPNGGTLSGTNCVCPSGQTDNGSACLDPQAAACQALQGQALYLTFNSAVSPGQTACDATGCNVTVGSPIIRARTPSGATVSEGEGTFTGSTCTPSPSTPASEPDTCVNGQPGQINGVDVCVPYSGSDDVETIDESSKETNEGGNTTEETTSKHTSCTNNSCTTTTTTTTITNGGAPVVRATQETESRDDFCTKNPRAQQCKESSFSGSCAAGFTCDGDAVQCAQARELYRLSCALQADSPEAALYAANASANPGEASIPSETVNIGPGAFDASNALGASACLADLTLTVWGADVTLPLSDVCPALDYLRLLLLAVAWLAAFRIVSVG